jgi:hypothetical protein
MRIWTGVRATLPLWLLLFPAAAVAQTPTTSSSRPIVSVLIAFAVSWLMVAAWVARIGSKVNRLLDGSEESDE